MCNFDEIISRHKGEFPITADVATRVGKARYVQAYRLFEIGAGFHEVSEKVGINLADAETVYQSCGRCFSSDHDPEGCPACDLVRWCLPGNPDNALYDEDHNRQPIISPCAFCGAPSLDFWWSGEYPLCGKCEQSLDQQPDVYLADIEDI